MQLEHAPDVRCLVLESAVPGCFCVGGDLKAFEAAGEDTGELVHRLAREAHAFLSTISRIDAPVISAVGGVAAGGGLGIALGADMVIAGESARFAPAYARIGFAVDCGLSWVLPRLVGMRKALDLLLTCPVLSAAEALELGLISEIVPDADLAARVDQLAAGLAAGPTAAFGSVRRLVRDAASTSLDAHLEREARAIARSAGSADGRAGVARFLG